MEINNPPISALQSPPPTLHRRDSPPLHQRPRPLRGASPYDGRRESFHATFLVAICIPLHLDFAHPFSLSPRCRVTPRDYLRQTIYPEHLKFSRCLYAASEEEEKEKRRREEEEEGDVILIPLSWFFWKRKWEMTPWVLLRPRGACSCGC